MNAARRHVLSTDLERMLDASPERRRLLRWLSAGVALSAGPMALAGCGGGGGDAGTAGFGSTTGSGTTTGSGSTTVSSCTAVPTETNGPYPADGTLASSQRLNALALSGIVRSDIRTSVASASGTAAGVVATLKIKLVNANSGCANLAGYAIYVWHCTRDGNYSLYSSGHTGQNYLRGVQVTDANGEVSFTTIFPGAYSGRWPHIHYEVYPSETAAIDAGSVGDWTKVSQIAIPEDACRTVYGSASGYSSSLTALNGVSLASDNVFSDGVTSQMATVSGSLSAGYVIDAVVGISV
ncbi:dioxygenase family protein [Aquabacterium sp. OR-4]|uniref:dioxygenase family protein n=1 Tax=Aquabacterium sp. OR-4 TaxID=2978127 RepID=UPI0021B3766A|nr:intradiol ring-cleavage dioxygenase [Aquabacterium sp. OR-4]MDT7835230.1 intradiol ring-cleavage dioxygenase [Aquabacterium sp. OR-4]